MAQSASGITTTSSADSVVAQMMLSDEYSDLAFSCRGELFKVHKAVVCTQSSVIRAAVRSGFQESETNTLNMDAFTPGSVRRFRQFLYTKNYDAINIQDDEDEAPPPPPTNQARANAAAATAADDDATPTNDAAGPVEASAPRSGRPDADRPESWDPVYRVILAHTRMNAMGDYYDVPGLTAVANARITASLSSASPDAPWILGLPRLAETALGIAHNAGLTEALAGAVAEHLGTLLATGALDACSSLMTPFCLEVLRKCSATNQALSETLSYKVRTLKEVGGKYQKAAEQVVQQKKAALILKTTERCRNTACSGKFQCYFDDEGGKLRCRVCRTKHPA